MDREERIDKRKGGLAEHRKSSVIKFCSDYGYLQMRKAHLFLSPKTLLPHYYIEAAPPEEWVEEQQPAARLLFVTCCCCLVGNSQKGPTSHERKGQAVATGAPGSLLLGKGVLRLPLRMGKSCWCWCGRRPTEKVLSSAFFPTNQDLS